MVHYENECRGCATEGYPCRGMSCDYRRVPHYICDDCMDDVKKLYHYGTDELCLDCIEKRLERVKFI